MSMGHETGDARTDAKLAQAGAAGCCALLIAALLAGWAAVEGAKRAWRALRPAAPYSVCEFCGNILDGRQSCPAGGTDDSGHVPSGERAPAGARGEVVAPHLVAGGHSSPATAPAGKCPDGADLFFNAEARTRKGEHQ